MRRLFVKISNLFVIGTLILVPLLVSGATVEELRQQIQKKQTEIQQLENQINAYKEEIKNKKSQESTLAKQINYMETQIKRLETEIKLAETKISETSLKIEEILAEIRIKNTDLEKQKNNLSETIRIIYEYDQETPIELIVKNDNFSDFLNQVQFIENLQASVKTKFDNIKSLKEELEGQKNDLEAQKGFLEQLRSDLSGKNLVINNQKDEKEDLLTQTKKQEKNYQTLLSQVQKKREEIQKEIYALEDKLRLTIDPNSIPASRPGLFTWPIKNIITQTYGPTSETGFINDAYKFHNGIDIAADIGDPVRAAYGGIVKARGDNGKYAYGKWIAIDHQNGLITLYAHFSGYAVNVGQKVTAGQTIGYAGTTGFSTGPHLHFTVYAANTFITEGKSYGLLPLGGSINPMEYL